MLSKPEKFNGSREITETSPRVRTSNDLFVLPIGE